jgi:fucose permease
VVLASAVIAAGGVLLLIAVSEAWTAALALLLVGAGFSPIFPTTLGLAGSAFESYSGTVFGILFAVALTGGMSLPWAAGQSAEVWGLRTALGLAAVNAGMIALLQLAIRRRVKMR